MLGKVIAYIYFFHNEISSCLTFAYNEKFHKLSIYWASKFTPGSTHEITVKLLQLLKEEVHNIDESKIKIS